jgi:hypothetical protein
MPSARFTKMVETYRRDNTHPVNHVMHVFMGWPLVGASLLLLPFRPWWSLGLFLLGYAIMFTGHFVFEKNTPTILKHPSTPFVMAWSVIRSLTGGLVRLASPSKTR